MDSTALLTQIFTAIGEHNWLMAIPLLTIVLIFALRTIAAKVKALVWFTTDQGGALLSLAGAVATAVVAAAATSGPHTFAQVVLVAFPVLISNKMIFLWLKKLGIDLSVDAPAPTDPADPVVPGGNVPPAAKAVIILVLATSLFWGGTARADCFGFTEAVECHIGPTIPALMFQPGKDHPVSLAAGVGMQLSLSLPQLDVTIGTGTWNMLALNLMAFGSLITGSAGQQFGQLSGAGGFCTFSSLLCVSGGYGIITSTNAPGGAFLLLSTGFQFALNGPVSPAQAVRAPRANTIVF